MSKDKGGKSDKKAPAKSQKEKKAAKAAKKNMKEQEAQRFKSDGFEYRKVKRPTCKKMSPLVP